MVGRRNLLLSTFIVAVLFATTLEATKCNKFQLKNRIKAQDQRSKSEKECSGCTGYVCKVDGGKTISGSACTEDVKELCQQKWDDSKLEKIAKNNGGYESVDGEYFVHSCQDDNCNTVQWFKDVLVKHEKFIASAGLSHQKRSHRQKRGVTRYCEVNGKEVPCGADIPIIPKDVVEHCALNGKEVPCPTVAPGSKLCVNNNDGKILICDPGSKSDKCISDGKEVPIPAGTECYKDGPTGTECWKDSKTVPCDDLKSMFEAGKDAAKTVEDMTKAAEEAAKTGKETVKKGEEAAKEAEKTAKKAEEAAKEAEKVEKEAEKVGEEVVKTGEETVKKSEEVAEDVAEGAEEAAKETEKVAEDTAEALGLKKAGSEKVGYGIGVILATLTYVFLY